MFRNREGQPFHLTQKQSEIFQIVYSPFILRGAIASYTQYGKSDVVSMAIITAAIERKEKVLIVAPSEDQASIIMRNVIDHLFDDPDITNMLHYDPMSIDRLRKERSKQRITFRNGSEIFILTADVRTMSKQALNLMGFGATIVIADEASLIPDALFAKILRMVGGVKNGKLIKLGNTFERNHFFNSLHSSRYVSLIIDYHIGLSEGRITQSFIDEAREDMTPLEFSIMYECNFPDSGSADAVIPLDWIELAINQQGVGGEKRQAGLDVARYGNDKSVYAFRVGGVLKYMKEVFKLDTMAVAGMAATQMDEDEPDVTVVDVVGLGAGVYDRLDELGYEVHPLSGGGVPIDRDAKERYYNINAEMYFNLRNLFKPIETDGKLRSQISIPKDADLIRDITERKYRFTSEKKIRLEDKEDFKKRLGRSPDKGDALAMAFYDTSGSQPEMIIL